MSDLDHRLRESSPLIIDGGTGTEIEKRGVPMDDASWCAAALDSHPEVVREVHESYIRAGAEVIIANTFTTSRHILEEAGLGDRFEELNARGVGLAREARERAAGNSEYPVYVAGSISTFPPRLDPAYNPSPERALENYRDQARILAGAGADLIAFEMVRDVEKTRLALSAALETGLPVWLGFSATRDENGWLVLWEGGQTLAEGVAELAPLGPSLVSVMHTLTEDAPEALEEIGTHWHGPLGAYPHSGRFIMPHWQFEGVISPEDFVAEACRWRDLGATAIGGCCGIGPEHIKLLREELRPGS
ncbi:homocysteine S-methyltransferase family protein [Rubrobacter aplysinae]|uniref:homocysteine S-methyltransferase family protein n=1 Tax=Rubrobacter aplysinae TaxID=909625 RepID=UPI00064C0424|nr:homocysteine S-methyltransferase family protein [Rubrobacter aplysinae]